MGPPVLLGKVFVREREEKTAPNMSQRLRKYLVRGWVCPESQVSEWDQGPSLEALRRPFSVGVLTVSAVSQAAPHPVPGRCFQSPRLTLCFPSLAVESSYLCLSRR